MVYKFRVILDNEKDVFRDIAILSTDSLEDLHNAIVNAFGFDGSEGGSFYTSDDDWSQNEEIPLFDMGEEPGQQKIMADFQIKDLLDENQTRILHIYDPFNMWTFFVELAQIEEIGESDEKELPALLYSFGEVPAGNEVNLEFDNDFDDDKEDFDIFDDDDEFNDFEYDDEY